MKQFGAVGIILLVFLQQAAASPCMKFKPAMITLRGTVVPTLFFGPPNFGEDPKTDERGKYPVLRLDRVIHLCSLTDGDFNVDSKTVREMQMIFFKPPFGASWNGKHVQVNGAIFPRETAWHHTPVMLEVVSIHTLK